jgi:hypothetical protein
MASCVLSSQNRAYVKQESSYGATPAVTSADRVAVIGLDVRQRRETRERRDKIGSRSYAGTPAGGRKRTEFSLQSYLVTNPSPGSAPPVGRLIQAALGASPLVFGGGTAGSGSTTTQIAFSGSHGLVARQAFGFNGEIRFVSQVVNSTTVQVNAPFSSAPASGNALTAAVTYFPADELPSLSIFDYWDPANAVDRIVIGAACDRMQVRINADYHELEFSGAAQDVIDSVSFTAGQGGLGSFPAEPSVSSNLPQPVPGNLGQAWLGSPSSRFLTVTSAVVEVVNELDLRTREFGSALPLCVGAGTRRVLASVELLEQDDTQTRDLYGAARSETPVGVMFQLGQTAGRLMGIYLPGVIPEAPEFDDGEANLKWSFSDLRAQGQANDEIAVAVG